MGSAGAGVGNDHLTLPPFLALIAACLSFDGVFALFEASLAGAAGTWYLRATELARPSRRG
jgi:hypothetical protein